MKTFIIIYELAGAGIFAQNSIVSKIQSLGQWGRPTSSVWLLKTSLSSREVFDQIRAVASDPSRLLVIEINTANWWTINVPKEVTDWLKKPAWMP